MITSLAGSPSTLVLLATAAVLFYVAVTDLKHFKIRNELILLIALLAVMYYLVGGEWRTLIWNVAFALLIFALMLYFYSIGLMGGGDLKLIFVALWWVGPFCAVEFAALLFAFSAGYAGLAKLGYAEVQMRAGRMAIPLAPSISAALIVVFASGGLDATLRASVYHQLGEWISRLAFEVAPWIPHT